MQDWSSSWEPRCSPISAWNVVLGSSGQQPATPKLPEVVQFAAAAPRIEKPVNSEKVQNLELKEREKPVREMPELFRLANQRPFQCPECLRCFGKEQALESHKISSGHGNGDGLECYYCCEKLVDKEELKEHLLDRHGQSERKAPFECTQCGRNFLTRFSMLKHVRKEHVESSSGFLLVEIQEEMRTLNIVPPKPILLEEVETCFSEEEKEGRKVKEGKKTAKSTNGSANRTKTQDISSQSAKQAAPMNLVIKLKYGSDNGVSDVIQVKASGKDSVADSGNRRITRSNGTADLIVPELSQYFSSGTKKEPRANQNVNIYRVENAGEFFRSIPVELIHRPDPTSKYECPRCLFCFTRASSVPRHMVLHELNTVQSPYECYYCFKGLESREEMREHILLEHIGVEPFSCLHCDRKFGTKNALIIHSRKVHQMFGGYGNELDEESSISDILTKAEESGAQQMDEVDYPLEVEELPPRKLSEATADDGYGRVVPTSQLMFPEDMDTFACGNAMSPRHRTPDSPMMFPCRVCFFPLSDAKRLREHLRDHSHYRHLECYYCLSKFQNVKELCEHVQLHSSDTEFKCTRCGHSYNFRWELQNHMKKRPRCDSRKKRSSAHMEGISQETLEEEHRKKIRTEDEHIHNSMMVDYAPEETSQPEPSPSEVLDFPTTGILGEAHREADSEGEEEQEEEDGGPQICKICLFSFKSPRSLLKHELLHAPGVLFECYYCLEEFQTKESLHKHIVIHNDTLSFQCKECGREFSARGHLRSHILVAHSGIQTFSKHNSEVVHPLII